MKGIWDWLHHPNRSQIPPELSLALRCRQWHTLPKAGGYLDQPVKRMKRMELALNYYDAFTSYQRNRDRMKPEDWNNWQKENGNIVALVAEAAKD